MAQDQSTLHLRAAQVEIAVLHAHHLIRRDPVLDFDGRGLGSIEDAQFLADHLDLAGFHVRIHRIFTTAPHFAAHGNAELGAQSLCLVEGLPHGGLVEHHLHQAGTVTHINKDQPAVIAAAGHPAAQRNFRADSILAQFTAVMGTLHAFKCFHFHLILHLR